MKIRKYDCATSRLSPIDTSPSPSVEYEVRLNAAELRIMKQAQAICSKIHRRVADVDMRTYYGWIEIYLGHVLRDQAGLESKRR